MVLIFGLFVSFALAISALDKDEPASLEQWRRALYETDVITAIIELIMREIISNYEIIGSGSDVFGSVSLTIVMNTVIDKRTVIA